MKNNRVVQDPATDTFPSTYWFGDEYECPSCRSRIVTGFGKAVSVLMGTTSVEPLQFDYERPEAGKEGPCSEKIRS